MSKKAEEWLDLDSDVTHQKVGEFEQQGGGWEFESIDLPELLEAYAKHFAIEMLKELKEKAILMDDHYEVVGLKYINELIKELEDGNG